MQEFSHYDFAVGLPQGWMDASVVVVAGPPNDGYSPSITITREQLEFQMDVSQYATKQLSALHKELSQDAYRVKEEGLLPLNGVSAYQRTHSFDISDMGVEVTQLQIYIIKEQTALTLTCTNLTEWFDRTKPIFMDAIRQFRWRSAQQ